MYLLVYFVCLFFRNLRDPYLVKLEQLLRAFCLKLTVSDSILKPLPPGCTFQIHIHTTETSSIEIQKDTEVCKLYINRKINFNQHNFDFLEISINTQ